jgi:hypothetical protein
MDIRRLRSGQSSASKDSSMASSVASSGQEAATIKRAMTSNQKHASFLFLLLYYPAMQKIRRKRIGPFQFPLERLRKIQMLRILQLKMG